MLQAASTGLFNPIVPKAHNCECQNLIFPLQNKPVKVNFKLNWWIFIFATPGTNGLLKLLLCPIVELASARLLKPSRC